MEIYRILAKNEPSLRSDTVLNPAYSYSSFPKVCEHFNLLFDSFPPWGYTQIAVFQNETDAKDFKNYIFLARGVLCILKKDVIFESFDEAILFAEEHLKTFDNITSLDRLDKKLKNIDKDLKHLLPHSFKDEYRQWIITLKHKLELLRLRTHEA